MRNHRRHKNKANNSIVNINRDYSSADDLHYFIEKIRNKGKSLTVVSYSQGKGPGIDEHYVEFMKQYIGFMLTNISGIYNELANWISNNREIRDKIQIIDSNDISSEVFSYVTAYLNKKLIPSVNSIALSLLGISEEKTVANLQTHNIPALAFMSPPGTSKTYSIVNALKKLSEGQGNSIIEGWLHYDVTKHEATTSPLVLPTTNQDVKDEPLPGLAILRASGKVELDKVLQENIYTKTVNKIINTFAYILNAGNEKGQISLSNEVESTLKQNIDLNSIEMSIWKLAVVKELDEKNVKELLDAFKNVTPGFVRVTNALRKNENYIKHADAESLINAISNASDELSESSDPEKDERDFVDMALMLHKLITFGLVPIIAAKFRKFIITNKLDETTNNNNLQDQNKRIEILDGIMYIYNKIHNYYLHRIISTMFLIKALLNTSGNYEEVFQDMIERLKNGLGNLLNAYYGWIQSSNTNTYLDLDKPIESLNTPQARVFDFYHKIYMFLINAQTNENNKYVKLDKMFIENVIDSLLGNTKNTTIVSETLNERGDETRQYKDARLRQYGNVKYVKEEFDYFSDNKLSFTDHVRLTSDIINDLYEVRKFYSNVEQNSLSNQDGKTTLEKLKSEFGTRFLDFSNTSGDDVPYILSEVFNFIDLIKKELTRPRYDVYKNIYKNQEYMDILLYYKNALSDLFKKSLSVIVNSPRYGYLIRNKKIDTAGIDINGLIGDYILSGLGITESLKIKGVNYSFPPAVQIFLLRAKQAYYKYLRQLRAMIEANMKRMNPTDSVNTAIRTLRPPLYVLFLDEIMTQLTPENFLFWLNIWNGLISPANPTVDTYPPNLCFVLAGNMPWSTFILFQALLKGYSEKDYSKFQNEFKKAKVNNIISVDTINALGSRISLRIVAYDYSYLLRTDESAVRTRTALFIRALTKGLLRKEGLIHFVNNAQNLLGGFYDYYKIIVEPRLNSLANLKLSIEKLMKLHAYIASLTAAPDNSPFDITKIVPNSTIKILINDSYGQYKQQLSQDKIDEAIRKATILNYLFNDNTFGKTIYDYMFGTYFEKNPKEADYFNRFITIAISPIVLHLSFLHSYLAWNNMMRKVSKNLIDKANINQDKSEIVNAITKLMKAIKDASKLLNTKMTTAESIEKVIGKDPDNPSRHDRLDLGKFSANRNDVIGYLESQGDPRLCDPEVGAVISLLSLVFYHYITYMKEFNKDISKVIVNFCEELESIISREAKNVLKIEGYNETFSHLKVKINNYFVDPHKDKDINSREDLLVEASEYAYDPSRSIRINLLSFDPDKKAFEVDVKGFGKSSEKYPDNADNSITVTLIPQRGGSNTEKGLDDNDIKAIKALVLYTIYTHSLVSRKTENNKISFSDNLLGNILVSHNLHAPLVGNLVLNFFRITDEQKLFMIPALRETDRWFTNVTSSIVQYVTIMTILKHILTYRYMENMPDMIKGFMDEVKKSNIFSTRVEDEIRSILNEFAELLFEARQAVFTPLANGGKQGRNNRYYLFNYKYNEMTDTIQEGYYTKPDNKVNFGPLSFVFEKIKDLNIVQYDNSNNSSKSGEEELINTIAERFVQYLRDGSQKSTTSFFPIHLISHIELPKQENKTEGLSGILTDFENISSLIYNNKNASYITMPDTKRIGESIFDLRHVSFYDLKKDSEYSIYAIIKALNHRLRGIAGIEQLKGLKSITALLEQNEKLENINASKSNNFIKLIYDVQFLSNEYHKIEIESGIFEDLEKVRSRYSSIGEYSDLWKSETERQNIIDFFKNLLAAAAQHSLDNLSKTVLSIPYYLDDYIVELAGILSKKVVDENVKSMLEKLSNKQKMNEYIQNAIKNIMNSGLESYISESRDVYISIKKDQTAFEEAIKHQIIVLSPLIKYSLAIILSNIATIEYNNDQYINKGEFYNKLRIAIKNDYDKTIRESEPKETDYLSMIIRYIFFDVNVLDDKNGKMTLSDKLITMNEATMKAILKNLGNNESGPKVLYQLVQPFFTHYDDKAQVIEIEGQNNKKLIKKREVFTQYVYVVNDEIPILYCDIHHMPIKGVQKIDGTLIEVPSKITIYSSEAFKSGESGYTYTQLTFMQNMVIPRYEFAKSALVNLLLIAGIQEIQKCLSDAARMLENFYNARFVSFAITNLYAYYKDEISQSNWNAHEFINNVIKNRHFSGKHKYLHPLLASIILTFNGGDEDVKAILENEYGLKNAKTYSHRDEFINALRLRFYSSNDTGVIQSIEYDMYSIYEPGVSIT